MVRSSPFYGSTPGTAPDDRCSLELYTATATEFPNASPQLRFTFNYPFFISIQFTSVVSFPRATWFISSF
ncbi:unnamed protein product [Citrullus colocynthis]|uniref:Uncharacterized protein n=1 Tax=Citrullus colocynthis TaxID=252529 RepID=A0ABP0YDV6_9ROSI